MSKAFDIRELKTRNALTVQQAAFYAGTSRPVVDRWLDNGDLGFYVLPHTSSKKRQRRIFRTELDDYLKSLYQKNQHIEKAEKRPLILLDRTN
ncbi:helix-turn-helix domain-containing protein [Gemmatimonadota bacterium]